MKVTLISLYKMIWSPGIRTLSSCLKTEGHDVQVIFMPKDFTESYEDAVLSDVVKLLGNSDLVGLGLMSNFFDNAIQVTNKVKENFDIPIIWGGVHPTLRPEECLKYADIVCRGEGESSLIELVGKMEKKQNYFDVKGLWFKVDGKIIKNDLKPLIRELDSVPFQDYSYENHYILHNGRICKMDEALLKKLLSGSYETMCTRGCPYGCTYCSNNALNNLYAKQNPLRRRSVENILQELVEIKTKLPFIECIRFDDDNFFTYTTKEIAQLCNEYKKKIGLIMHITGAHPNTVEKEKLSLLVDAGLVFIRMGIQTGSKKTKKIYNRIQTNQQVINAARTINLFKDKIPEPQYDIILDNPWETDEDLVETLMFLTKIPTPYYLELLSLTFYPETALHKKAKDDGLLADDVEEVYRKLEYHNCQDHYFNNLFFLLRKYAQNGTKISTRMMGLLTNTAFRKLGISWLFYKYLSKQIENA